MLGHYRAAVEDLDEADCRSPGDVRTCLLFAGLLASCPIDELRDGQAAVEYARRACVELEWSDWYSVAILANAYAEAGNWREALRFAREARRLAPEDQQQERDERIRQFEARRPFRLPVEPDEPLPEEEPA